MAKSSISLFRRTPRPGTIAPFPKEPFSVVVRETAEPSGVATERCVVSSASPATREREAPTDAEGVARAGIDRRSERGETRRREDFPERNDGAVSVAEPAVPVCVGSPLGLEQEVVRIRVEAPRGASGDLELREDRPEDLPRRRRQRHRVDDEAAEPDLVGSSPDGRVAREVLLREDAAVSLHERDEACGHVSPVERLRPLLRDAREGRGELGLPEKRPCRQGFPARKEEPARLLPPGEKLTRLGKVLGEPGRDEEPLAGEALGRSHDPAPTADDRGVGAPRRSREPNLESRRRGTSRWTPSARAGRPARGTCRGSRGPAPSRGSRAPGRCRPGSSRRGIRPPRDCPPAGRRRRGREPSRSRRPSHSLRPRGPPLRPSRPRAPPRRPSLVSRRGRGPGRRARCRPERQARPRREEPRRGGERGSAGS